ncbi:MAG TPA: class I SAM-dependent methyltransferase [Bryobacteraceae bacterium]|nr:class I SAM-dependent methyltransferase [Bryobacteraceae bacterium]
MNHAAVQSRLPAFLRRYVLDFERRIEDAVRDFAAGLPAGARVLDAGAGELQYAKHFDRHRYVAVDLACGDELWDYSKLNAIADLVALPFPCGAFDAAINIVTLEHVAEPGAVIRELGRVLAPGGALLLVVPQDWEVHQAPHDYFRYTRYGVRYLLERAGFTSVRVYPAGGFFRLLSRRLLNALSFFHGVWFLPAALVLAPPALLLPALDRFDRDRNFTLGYICTARRRS